MSDVTIFEQDGYPYLVLSHKMPLKELARETAKAIRGMVHIARSRMRVVPREELRTMNLKTPHCDCRECVRDERRGGGGRSRDEGDKPLEEGGEGGGGKRPQ